MSSSDDEFETMMAADGFDLAIIGVAQGVNTKPCLAYSYEACIQILMREADLTEESAQEWMDTNVCNAYVGERSPIFIYNFEEEYNA